MQGEDLPLLVGQQFTGLHFNAQFIAHIDAVELPRLIGQMHCAHGGPRVVLFEPNNIIDKGNASMWGTARARHAPA